MIAILLTESVVELWQSCTDAETDNIGDIVKIIIKNRLNIFCISLLYDKLERDGCIFIKFIVPTFYVGMIQIKESYEELRRKYVKKGGGGFI